MKKLSETIKRISDEVEAARETKDSSVARIREEKITHARTIFGKDADKVEGMNLRDITAVCELGLVGLDIDNAIELKDKVTPEQAWLIVKSGINLNLKKNQEGFNES